MGLKFETKGLFGRNKLHQVSFLPNEQNVRVESIFACFFRGVVLNSHFRTLLSLVKFHKDSLNEDLSQSNAVYLLFG